MTRRHLAKRSKQALECGMCVAMPSKHTSCAQVVMANEWTEWPVAVHGWAGMAVCHSPCASAGMVSNDQIYITTDAVSKFARATGGARSHL